MISHQQQATEMLPLLDEHSDTTIQQQDDPGKTFFVTFQSRIEGLKSVCSMEQIINLNRLQSFKQMKIQPDDLLIFVFSSADLMHNQFDEDGCLRKWFVELAEMEMLDQIHFIIVCNSIEYYKNTAILSYYYKCKRIIHANDLKDIDMAVNEIYYLENNWNIHINCIDEEYLKQELLPSDRLLVRGKPKVNRQTLFFLSILLVSIVIYFYFYFTPEPVEPVPQFVCDFSLELGKLSHVKEQVVKSNLELVNKHYFDSSIIEEEENNLKMLRKSLKEKKKHIQSLESELEHENKKQFNNTQVEECFQSKEKAKEIIEKIAKLNGSLKFKEEELSKLKTKITALEIEQKNKILTMRKKYFHVEQLVDNLGLSISNLDCKNLTTQQEGKKRLEEVMNLSSGTLENEETMDTFTETVVKVLREFN